MSSNAGTLWVVATPIGNPGDLSPRALKILQEADAILAEDTRRTGQLFARLGLSCRGPMYSLHDHNEQSKTAGLVELLKSGQNFALVSDAGTPLMSDPGYRLVQACRQEGLKVSPVPGPSAPIAALSASGLPPIPFVFLGFLPRKNNDIAGTFEEYKKVQATIVFFERKDRLKESLKTAFSVFGNRQTVIARELTKTFEEFIPINLSDTEKLPEELPGEITVLIAPADKTERDSEETVLEILAEETAVGGKPKDVARRAKERVRGWNGKDIYRLLQET